MRASFRYLALCVCLAGLGLSGRAEAQSAVSFREFLIKRFTPVFKEGSDKPGEANRLIQKFCPTETNRVAERVLFEYGAIYSADGEITIPDRCIFTGESDVSAFQTKLKVKNTIIGAYYIELQKIAMDALLAAQEEAEESGLQITPLDGSIGARRSYADTVRIWNSRFLPALKYWVERGRISRVEADEARQLTIGAQVCSVLDWETEGIYFSTNFTRSIFSATAPPGTSQHLSLLAFDVVQYGDLRIRKILNDHGWFQTIVNDQPHFTYLGVTEKELPSRGLKSVRKGNHVFWIPNMDGWRTTMN